jgi:integrase
MSHRRIPSYRLHKPSGQAVVTLNGKDYYLGPWMSKASRFEYDRLISEWIANGRQMPSATSIGEMTVSEFLVAYWNFAKGYYTNNGQPTKELSCLREALRPLKRLYGHSLVHDFGPLALKSIQRALIDSDLCRTHINHQVNRIRRVFKWGVENELVPSDVLHGLRAVMALKKGRTEARESEPVQPVPDEHVDAVLPHVSRQVATMIELQRITGMRSGELVVIRPVDIDRTGDVWIYAPADHKTAYRGHEREIYFGLLSPSISHFPLVL